ncbi:MAG: Inorganic pyrophosphatase [Parcubacteria group bacterium GW2011_GWA2_36_10]|nr:MAG: Inorganic pyrophosphatase [Parcubacteria group bacterium GW2011_GWA2_36_10]
MSSLAENYLGKNVDLIIDRSLGSKHPKHSFIYEVNYGYVPNTVSGDGEELDAYFLGADKPLKKASGQCIAIIHRLDDDDDKLVVISKNIKDFTDKEIKKLTDFQEKFFKSVIIRKSN